MNEKIKASMLCYWIRTMDPVHIGTGGYRLDYIDNTIVLDYDGVPKIPGTSLSGVARHYLAKCQDQIEEGSQCGGNNCECGGTCKVCRTFGVAKDSLSRKGVVRFSDALILFFPVNTIFGTVWLTTVQRLLDFKAAMSNCNYYPSCVMDTTKPVKAPGHVDDESYYPLYGHMSETDLIVDGYVLNKKLDVSEANSLTLCIPESFQRNLIMVSEKVFIQSVRQNLTVRTSVTIDPETRTAEDTGLFTYEAIPRNTYLFFQITFDIPNIIKESDDKSDGTDNYLSYVHTGMGAYRIHGIGGMTSRGFGRLQWKQINRLDDDNK